MQDTLKCLYAFVGFIYMSSGQVNLPHKTSDVQEHSNPGMLHNQQHINTAVRRTSGRSLGTVEVNTYL